MLYKVTCIRTKTQMDNPEIASSEKRITEYYVAETEKDAREFFIDDLISEAEDEGYIIDECKVSRIAFKRLINHIGQESKAPEYIVFDDIKVYKQN